MDGVYLTWLISALAIGVLLLPLVKPPWSRITMEGFIDFLRRYWLHIGIVLSIYNAKDFLDEVDRILMANTDGMLDMTPWIYAIEGDMVLWVQQTFMSDWLTAFMTHFYVVGFMVICYVSVFFFAYFDDRYMADRISLTIFWVYILAIPFYLFFNVLVTGNYIPEMKTLAYDHTPEINDWFHRIDPLTNGMPSLHIGFPFAVWLCLLRNDNDNRWIVYRRIVFVYVVLTAFCILYLGIHWFMDIIGGMAVAAMAVSLADRMAGPLWGVLDERTINARMATVLTNPKRAFGVVKSYFSTTFKKYTKPTSRETGVMLTVVMILVAGVITWDLTHQSLPAGGVDSPVAVSAADGWMATLDDRGEGELLVVHKLSEPDSNIYVVQPLLDLDSSHDVKGDILLMANSTTLYLVDLNQPDKTLLEMDVDNPQDVCLTNDGKFAILQAGQISYFLPNGSQISGPSAPDGDSVLIFEADEENVALVLESDPDTVHMGIIGAEGMIALNLNASASEVEDEILIEAGGNVDIENAKITEIALNRDHLAATVNVNATTRLVLLDTISGESKLISDPKYEVSDPYISDGILIFATYQNIDPVNASEKYQDREILIHDIAINLTEPLTADSVDQWSPMVSEDHYIYQEMNIDGVISVEVQEREPSLKPYASNILQIGVVLGITLVFVNLMQRQKEAKQK